MEPARNPGRPLPASDMLRRLQTPDYPLCREDVLWALDYIKHKVADGAPEWSELDRPQLLAHFACYASLAMRLVQRQSLCGEDAACLRAMLADMR
ncbi:hypothetical protein [Cohnella sp. REN36]|uniref:hypothetical protein n=1 Tax=Cohnella sp. REN36 TaxID=2887347 RepID=UPI001D159CF7|nr:hypothetical protein [Cohnella sp. REN36]MCC3372947.1 hypothetical protein [Cohnella sp. REN36]